MSFEQLPQEVLLNIFSYLSVQQRFAIRRVCKLWCELSLLGVKSINFHFEVPIHSLLYYQFGFSLQRVFVSNWSQVNNVLRNCSNLKSIVFEHCSFASRDIVETSKLIASIKELHVIVYRGIHSKIIDDMLKRLTRRATKIEEFTAILCSSDLKNVQYNWLYSILRRNRQMKVLRIHMNTVNFDFTVLPSLEMFELVCRQKIPYSVLHSLLQSLLKSSERTLKKLSFGESSLVDGECVDLISRFVGLKDLRLKLAAADDVRLLRNENLETLAIGFRYCGTIIDAEHYFPSPFKQMTHLRRLRLHHVVTENLIEQLCSNLSHLLYLHINGSELSEKSIDSFWKLRKLEVLCIKCLWSDASMAKFVRGLHSLLMLSWERCYSGRTDGIETIQAFIEKANNNPHLMFAFYINRFFGPFIEYPRNLIRKRDELPMITFVTSDAVFPYP